MVLAFHLILSAYGFWLPNDERGSWSQFVRAYELARFGPATKTTARRSVAHRRYDPIRHDAMLAALARSPVVFDGHRARAVARGLSDYAARSPVPIYACAVMPNHAHLVLGRSRLLIERVCEQLKGAATAQLNREGRPSVRRLAVSQRPAAYTVGAQGMVGVPRPRCGHSASDPLRQRQSRTRRLRPQRWSFVTAYEQQWAGTLRVTR